MAAKRTKTKARGGRPVTIRMRVDRRDKDTDLRDIVRELYGDHGNALIDAARGRDMPESAQRAAYDNLQTIQRVGVAKPAPATEAALNDLQAALSILGSEVIQLRNELELALQPAGPRATAGDAGVPDVPRSPLTRRIRSMIGDANGTADMLRDIRDRLEMGPQETPF